MKPTPEDKPFSVAVIDTLGGGELTAQRATELCAASFAERGFDLHRVGEISVALVSSNQIKELNVKFRDKDQPTDVLSFEVDGVYGEMVGEIVISPESVMPEMGIEELVVHGTLHLSGMDHGEDFEGTEMAEIQEKIMRIVSVDEK